MGKLGSHKASRSLAKIGLEDGLRLVNDFYWGIRAATTFSGRPSVGADLRTFLTSEPIFTNQGRLRPDNITNLILESQKELPRFAILLLFSYFEPYLRTLWVAALLGNLGVLNDAPGSVDGEEFAHDSSFRTSIQKLCLFRVEPLLKGIYSDRFAKARKLFGIPKSIVDPYIATVDEYYAKRNCLVHFQGRVDSRAKKHFPSDNRNQIGQRVVIEHTDFLTLHRTIHLISDELDDFMIKNHIANTELLRLLYELKEEHPDWKAKDFTRELLRLRLPGKMSRNLVAELLAVPKK